MQIDGLTIQSALPKEILARIAYAQLISDDKYRVRLRLIPLLFFFAFILPSRVLAVDAQEIIAAIANLRTVALSPETQQNIINYVSQSSSPVVHEGLSRLLEKDRHSELVKLKRAAKRIRIDGSAREWRTKNFKVNDQWDEWYPINTSKPIRKKRAEFDTLSYGFVSNGRYLYLMSKPRKMPRRGEYYHVINLMNSSSGVFYSIAWTNNGNYINEFRTSDNSWIRAFVPKGMRSVKGRVFEARVPLRALNKLPEYYHPSSVAWDETNNAYNQIWSLSPHSSLSEKYKNYALELFARYAESAVLSPDDPLPVAQALADAHIYRMGTASVRDMVVSDGILMFDEARKTTDYSFSNQEKLKQLSLDQIILWSNRTYLYAIQNIPWKFREVLSKNGERLTEEIYRFLFLDPAVFDEVHALIATHNLIVPGDLPATLWKIEETVANTQHYRASLDFLKNIAERIGTEYWWQIYEEAKFEEENNLNVITEVNGVPIYKSWNYSASFQIKYFNEHGAHYGDCGDVTIISLAIVKALGIPALHIHYDLIDDNLHQAIHSFPAYYSSATNLYLGFRTGYNIVWDWIKSGREGIKVLYYYDLPVDEWFSLFYIKPLVGTKIWSASNQKVAVISMEEWESYNSGGFLAP